MLCGSISWCRRAIRCLGELTACMFRPCLSLDIKPLANPCIPHPPAFPGIPQAGPADHLQLKFRLALAQHSLYVYLLMTQPVFIREKFLPPVAQKQFTGWKETDANVCGQEKACEKPINAKILMGLCNCLEANENALGFL